MPPRRFGSLRLPLRLQSPFGALTDSEYTLLKDFKSCAAEEDRDDCEHADQDEWIAAINALEATNGGDAPESQSIAVYRAASDWSWSSSSFKVWLGLATTARVGDSR